MIVESGSVMQDVTPYAEHHSNRNNREKPKAYEAFQENMKMLMGILENIQQICEEADLVITKAGGYTR